MTDQYWRGAIEDEVMQDEHGFLWLAMLEMVDFPLTGCKVLDVGCNRGGFLRLLVDRAAIGGGFGYDPAPGAIEDARRLAGPRALTFEVAQTVPSDWSDFDIAFSHEVLYVLHDLRSHAAALFAALDAGGVYYATMGVHADSPLMVTWHGEKATELDLPGPYRLDDVADVFEDAGFDVAVGRLPMRFVPAHAHRGDSHEGAGLSAWLDYYSHDKLMFRFTKLTS
jgi:SAM-dependent methyltransferase